MGITYSHCCRLCVHIFNPYIRCCCVLFTIIYLFLFPFLFTQAVPPVQLKVHFDLFIVWKNFKSLSSKVEGKISKQKLYFLSIVASKNILGKMNWLHQYSRYIECNSVKQIHTLKIKHSAEFAKKQVEVWSRWPTLDRSMQVNKYAGIWHKHRIFEKMFRWKYEQISC